MFIFHTALLLATRSTPAGFISLILLILDTTSHCLSQCFPQSVFVCLSFYLSLQSVGQQQ